MTREWIATQAHGWLHVGWATRSNIHHGPQYETEFEVQKVLSYKAASAKAILAALGASNDDQAIQILSDSTPTDYARLDDLLVNLADTGLLGIESQTSEYVGSGMIEDHYDNYSLLVRFDEQIIHLTHVTRFNDDDSSISEYEIPIESHSTLLSQYGHVDKKLFFKSFNLSDFKAWHGLHEQIRALVRS